MELVTGCTPVPVFISRREHAVAFDGNRNIIYRSSKLKSRRYTNCSILALKCSYLSQCHLQAGRYSPPPVDTYCCVQNSCTASTQSSAVCTVGHFFGDGAGLRAKPNTFCDMDGYSQWHCAYWQHMDFRQPCLVTQLGLFMPFLKDLGVDCTVGGMDWIKLAQNRNQ